MTVRKLQAGFIPLIILIVVGIVIAGAGGVYIVRNEFTKTGKSGKATLDEGKIQEQIENPKPLPTIIPTPSPQLAPNSFTFTPEASETKAEKEPGFKINPPSGWNQTTMEGYRALFQSPDKDEEKLEDPLVYTMPANIQVKMDSMENYDTLKKQGSTESGILDTIVAIDIKKNLLQSYNPVYVNDQRTTLAGQEAHLLEFKIKLDSGAIEHVYQYILFKGKYGVLVEGHVLDIAWGKRASTIKASLSSFTFAD